MRPSEVAELAVADLDFTEDVAHVIGKGRRSRALPFGQQTGLALGRYLRTRARERQADRSELWLAEKNRGALSSGGIGRMLRRRGDAVGIPGLHATSSGTRRPTNGSLSAAARPTSCG